MLDDEEGYFGDLLHEQEAAVRRYGRYRTALLAAGAACIIAAVIWMVTQADPKDSMLDMFVKAYVPLGGGLITASTSAYPIKEIVGRREKIITYNRLLAIVQRLKKDATASPDDTTMVRGKMQSIIDTITKGC